MSRKKSKKRKISRKQSNKRSKTRRVSRSKLVRYRGSFDGMESFIWPTRWGKQEFVKMSTNDAKKYHKPVQNPSRGGLIWHVVKDPTHTSQSKTPFLKHMTLLPPVVVWDSVTWHDDYAAGEIQSFPFSKNTQIPYPGNVNPSHWNYCQMGAHASLIFINEEGEYAYMIFEEKRPKTPFSLTRQFGGTTDEWKEDVIITSIHTIFKEFWEETGFQSVFDDTNNKMDQDFQFGVWCNQLAVKIEENKVLVKTGEKIDTQMKQDITSDDIIIEQMYQLHSKWNIQFPYAYVNIIKEFVDAQTFDNSRPGWDNFKGWAIVNSATHDIITKTPNFEKTTADLEAFAQNNTSAKQLPIPQPEYTEIYFKNLPKEQSKFLKIYPIYVSSMIIEIDEEMDEIKRPSVIHIPKQKIMVQDLA